MAYRKRKTLSKRRPRVTKRAFKRARKNVRRKSKRVLSTPVLHQSETIDTQDVILTITNQNFVEKASLEQFPRLLALSRLYEQYRINKVTVAYTPKQTSQFWTGPLEMLQTTSEPLTAVTYNNKENSTVAGTGSLGVSSFNEAMNRPSARKHSVQRRIARTVRGTMMVPSAVSGSNFSRNSPWLPTYQEDGNPDGVHVVHQGIGVYFPALNKLPSAGQIAPAFSVVKSIHVSFKGRRTN